MRRDVQLFVDKVKLNPPSIGTTNLVTDNVLNTEDESVFDFENNAAIDNGRAKLTSHLGSSFSMSQSPVSLYPSKKYRLDIKNLEYGPEKLVINRAFNSEQFNQSTWTKSNTSVTANTAVAPDGTTTADRMFSFSSTNYAYDASTQVTGEEMYISVYVKKETSSIVSLRAFAGGGKADFNLDTGTLVSEVGVLSLSKIYPAGNGWYRIVSMVTPTSSGSANFGFGDLSSYQSIWAWGFQLEHGNALSPYVRNTNSTIASKTYTNQTEQQISNYLTYSNALSNAAWYKSRITNTDGQASYFGDLNGTKLQGSGVTNRVGYTYMNTNITNQTSNYVFSCYVKKGDSNYISTRFYEFRASGPKYTQMTVNLSTGAVTNSYSSSTVNFTNVEYMSDGWYKVSVGISTLLTTAIQVLLSPKYDDVNWITTDTTAGAPIAYVSNLQIEENLAQGQYIPAPTSSAVLLSKPNNQIVISDRSDGTGGLNATHTLTEGTNNLSIPFTTNANTSQLYIRSGIGAASYELSIDQLDIFERIDAYESVEQTSVDLFDFEDINIVDKIKDARDIGKVFTEYSDKFTIPASPKNNETFSHFYNEDVVSGYDHRIKHPAVIKIGGADYKHGQLSLTSSAMKNGVPYSYSVVFYGNTVTLKDLIGDDKLPDLQGTILDALQLEYSAANIKDLVEVGLNFDIYGDLVPAPTSGNVTPDVFVPFISCESHYFYDNVDLPQVKDRVDSRNVRFGSAQTKKGIYYKDLKLAVKVKYVLQAIEEKYGIKFSNDFFNEDIAEFNELSIFLHREKGSISNQLESTNISFPLSELTKDPSSNHWDWRGEASYNQDTTGYDRDYLTMVDTQVWQFNSVAPTFYTYRINFDVEVTGGGEYEIEILDTSSGALGDGGYYWTGAGNKSVSHIFRDGTQGSGADSRFYYAYVKPRFKISTQSGISDAKITNFTLTYVESASTGRFSRTPEQFYDVHIDSVTPYLYNNDVAVPLSDGVDISSQIPNMKTLDFLTSLFKMFNLTAYKVPENDISPFAGQIRVRPLDSFYLSGNEIDVTEYIDTSKMTVNRNNLFSSVEYEFAKHSTLASIKQNQKTADVFGSELMNNLNGSINAPIAFDGGKYKVKANFEKVMYERMTDQANETYVLDIQWGWMVSKDENPILGKPLLFYPIWENLAGTVDEGGGAVALDFDSSIYDKNGDIVTSTHASVTRYIRPSNSLAGNLNSLNFGSEFDEWYVWEGAGTNENSLFQRHHKNYLLSIYDIQSRLVDLTAYLPIHIVMKLKLNDVVIIKGRRYRINSLNLNITTGKAKMELMNDIAYSKLQLFAPKLTLLFDGIGSTLFEIFDQDMNNDAIYKLYVDDVYKMDFSGTTALLLDGSLTAGAHNVTARKAKYYDVSTFIESEDSNIISITT